MFGGPAGLLELCFGVFGTCLLVFAVLFLVILVPITVGCGKLGGKGVVMVLLRGPESASEDFLNQL